DKRVMKPTLEALRKAGQKVKEARSSVEADRQNPFTVADELAAAKAALDRVNGDLARNDRDIYAEAERSLGAADSAIQTARGVAQRAKTDDITASRAMTAAYRDIEELAGRLSAAKPRLSEAHGDWHALDQEADAITAEAGRVAGTLRGELEAAREAASAISNA